MAPGEVRRHPRVRNRRTRRLPVIIMRLRFPYGSAAECGGLATPAPLRSAASLQITQRLEALDGLVVELLGCQAIEAAEALGDFAEAHEQLA